MCYALAARALVSTAVQTMITPANAAHWLRHDFPGAIFSVAASHWDWSLASRRLFIVMTITLACWVGCGAANAEEQSRRVLLLDAYNNTLPAPATFDQAVRNRLRGRSGVKIDAYTEFLDLLRFPEPAHEFRRGLLTPHAPIVFSATADVVLEILAGRDPSTISSQVGTNYNFAVDARQLERWKLSEAALPVGTEISFGKPTLWQEHRVLILSAIAALSLQTVIIIFVLIQSRRRRQAEQSLKESEERTAFAAASTSTGFWQIDTSDWSLWTTDYCRTLFGFAADARLTLETLLDRVHPEDRAGVAQTMRTAVRLGRPVELEFRVLQTDGEICWLAARGHLRDGDADRSPCLSGIFTDITALKTAESDAE